MKLTRHTMMQPLSRALGVSIRALNAVYRFASPQDKTIDSVSRVVIFCPYSGVGNLLMWIPALRALRSRWPEVEVTLAGPSEEVALPLLKAGLAERALHFRPVADKSLKEQYRFVVGNIRPLSADVALCTFLEPPRRASWWALLSGAGIRIGYGSADRSLLLTECLDVPYDRHEVVRNMMMLQPLGIDEEPPDAGYVPGEPDSEWADAWMKKEGLGSPAVGLHPGSAKGERERRKRWAVDKFVSAARSLMDKGVGVVIFEGPDEGEVVAAMVKDLGGGARVLRNENLGRVAAVMKRMDAVVANDSGLMHLASAVGAPVVAIFGPTDHVKNSPWSEKSIVLRRDCPDAPCYLMQVPPCLGNLKCLDEISEDDVVGSVMKFIKG